MTTCADSTAFRAHLDHPDPELEAHLDACTACAGLLRSVALDAGHASRALGALQTDGDADVDPDAALAAVLDRAAPVAATPRPDRRRTGLWRRLATSGAAALLVLVVALTPAGRSAVADALDAFRGERLQVVPVDVEAWAGQLGPEDVAAIEAIGDLDLSALDEPTDVADLAAAQQIAGTRPPQLAEAPDHVVALAPGTIRLDIVARDGNGVPADLDGAALVIDVPGAIGAVYGTAEAMPELVVGRSDPLVIRAEGAPLETVRSFLLSREELPEDLRTQLAAIGDWRSTTPLPIPVDGPGWQEVEVAGRPAVAFGDDSGLGAVVIRQDADGLTIVGGPIGVTRALELAEGA